MCFSVQVDKDLKKLAKQFNATLSVEGFKAFEALQRYEAVHSPEHMKTLLGLKRKPSSAIFKDADGEGRIYPGYWAPVIVLENDQRVIKPMRYRVRPKGSREEIPSQYNVFNCRLDSIDQRKTWQSLFMKTHALFPFVKFYEWVEREGKKTLIYFQPQNHEVMWAPALYDNWTSPDGVVSFDSFALITDDPPNEVSQAGYDRCPIYLNKNNINSWLSPHKRQREEVFQMLKQKEVVYYASAVK